VDAHRLKFRAVGEEGHERRGLVLAVVGGEGVVGFLLQDRDAFGAAAAVADGEVDFNAVCF